ncbi:hypothetical protein ACNI65_15215 [Roseateles sp. So40a]|uniref:hypothetical protein n=1 Tax=Roseateles sp. So40a TaxID=3400226 RepID=UPI003A88A10F
MTVQINYVNPFSTPDGLVTIMVRPVPTPAELSEGDAVLELLKGPSLIFGAPYPQSASDARCRRCSWDTLFDALDQLERRHISVTHLRHLLHLAAHFMARHGLRRGGAAVLTRFDHDDVVSLQYEMPIQVTHDEAQAWTMALWGELSYIDMLRSGFLFSFIDEPAA